MKKFLILFVIFILVLVTAGAIIPVRQYERGGCFVSRFKRLDLIQGESIKTLDDKQASYNPAPNEGMCDPTAQTIKLYIL
jgi:hypothetical protein